MGQQVSGTPGCHYTLVSNIGSSSVYSFSFMNLSIEGCEQREVKVYETLSVYRTAENLLSDDSVKLIKLLTGEIYEEKKHFNYVSTRFINFESLSC